MAIGNPWDWVPPAWLTPPPVDPSQLQPGLGIPQATLDGLPPPEIEMPAMDVAQPAELEMPAMDVSRPEPVIGFPRLVEDEQPAPLPVPDAVSGVGGVLPAQLQPGLGIPTETLDALPLPPQEQEQALEPVPAQTPTPPAEQPQLPVEYMTPEERAAYRVNQDADRAAMVRKRQAEALLADEQSANEQRQIIIEARDAARRDMDQARVEAQRLANEKVTAEDWYEEGGIGRTVGAVLAAVAGGLVQHLNGGRNIGLDMIDKQIDRFIVNRRANIAHRRAMLGDQMQASSAQLAQAVADQREEAAFRMAALQRTQAAIELEAQNYDPQGSKGLALADALDEIKARRAKAEADEAERFAKLNEAQRKAFLEERKQQEAERHNRAAEKASQTSAYARLLSSRTGAKKADAEIEAMREENKPRSVEELRTLFPNAPAELFSAPMSLKQFKTNLETSKQASMASKEAGEAQRVARENSPEERERKLGVLDIKDKKGKPIQFADSETRRRISKKRGAVDNAARIIDQVLALRQKYGWSSDLFRSPEWQAAQSNAQSLYIELKTDAELGVLAGPDMEILEKMSGGDPTQVRDPKPSLEQLRANMVNNLNGVLRAEAPPSQEPSRYEPPKLEALEAEERDVGADLDVQNAPEIESPDVPLEIRQRAAGRAAQGVESLTRKIEVNPANIATIQILIAKYKQRNADGLLSDEQANQAIERLEKRKQQIIDELDSKSMGKTKKLIDDAYEFSTGGR